MPKSYEVNGTRYEFPDGMSDDQVQDVLTKQGVIKAAAPEAPSVGGFGRNLVKGGERFAGDLANAVLHPIDTLSAVGAIATGGVQKMIPGEQAQEANFDALLQSYVDRYGSADSIKKTLYEDPVSVLADIATLAGGVGAAAKGVQVAAGAGKLTRAASAAGKVASAAGKVAAVTDPVVGTAKAIGAAGKATGATRLIPKSLTPRGMYQSALKPPPASYSPEEVGRMVETGLNEKIPVNPGGLEKLRNVVDEINSKIGAQIDEGAQRGVTVDPQAVANRVDQVRPRFASQVNPTDDLAALDKSKAEFLRQHSTQPPAPTSLTPQQAMTGQRPAPPPRQPVPIPADEAQRIKQGTYRQLKDRAYGELKSADVEAQKALARGIKEELAAAFPEIAALNARESALIGLEGALERALNRGGNHQLFGIGTPLAAAGVKSATGSHGLAMIAGGLRALLDDPSIKSKLAIAIRQAAHKNPAKYAKPGVAPAGARIQGYLNYLAEQMQQPALVEAQ